jgi:hypothetical protein
MESRFATLVTALLTFLAAVVGALGTYWLTKKRERDTELRKEKLEHYKAFVDSLSGIIIGEDSPEGHEGVRAGMQQSDAVCSATGNRGTRKVSEETRATNTVRDKRYHDQLLSSLLLEIRKDLKVEPKDQRGSFKVWLWAPGVKLDHSETDLAFLRARNRTQKAVVDEAPSPAVRDGRA